MCRALSGFSRFSAPPAAHCAGESPAPAGLHSPPRQLRATSSPYEAEGFRR